MLPTAGVSSPLEHAERAAEQERYSEETLAAIVAEEDLPRIPSTIAPLRTPLPHDRNTSATIGPAMNKMAAAKRSIPVAGGFLLLAISL
jgi:hypothetical protein